jgi:FMN phosphatase YigB (HAD superfamily)
MSKQKKKEQKGCYPDKVCLVLDLDDTLISNAYKYHAPMYKCALLVTKFLGVNSYHPRELIKRYDELDRSMVKKYSFQQERTGISWIKLLHQLIKERKMEVKKRHLRKAEKKIKRVSLEFKKGNFPFLPGVKKILKQFSENEKFYLVLLTVGDPKVQKKKIKKTKTARYFDEIIITDNSKIKALKKLALKFGAVNTWMVGNSPHSDIGAANKAGVKSVLIPRFTWNYELSDEAKPDFVFEKFSELLKLWEINKK